MSTRTFTNSDILLLLLSQELFFSKRYYVYASRIYPILSLSQFSNSMAFKDRKKLTNYSILWVVFIVQVLLQMHSLIFMFKYDFY